jgi:hypothetical protein
MPLSSLRHHASSLHFSEPTIPEDCAAVAALPPNAGSVAPTHPLVDENLERVVLRCMPEDVVGLKHLVE